MNSLRYLWAHPYGRLALLALVVGIVGLTTHLWIGFAFAGVINRQTLLRTTRSLPVRAGRAAMDRTPN